MAVDETPDTDDVALVTDAYESVYYELQARHLVNWGIEDDIPDDAAFPVRSIVANRVSPDFGFPENPGVEVEAIRQLARIMASDYHGEAVQVEYY